MLFSADAPLQLGVQEGILHPAHHQESLRNQENILLPIHPPLIINLNKEEDQEEDEEDHEEEENCKQFFPFFYKEVEEGFFDCWNVLHKRSTLITIPFLEKSCWRGFETVSS